MLVSVQGESSVVTLSRKNIRFFKDNGYLIRRKVLDPDLMARARDRLWDGAPPDIDRDDPESWIGTLEKPPDYNNTRDGCYWCYREPGNEDWMTRLLATDPSVWGMAEQLLGAGSLQTPAGIRGIYCIMPEGDVPKRPYGCHVDAHPFHLGVVGYIDRVGPNGGGFTVWPGSHKQFYYDFHSAHKMEPTEQYQADMEQVNRQPYVDCHGGPGDIVFWHHRIGHSGGYNRSRQIRKAVLYEYRKKDLYRTQEQPPPEDMWRDWSDATKEA